MILVFHTYMATRPADALTVVIPVGLHPHLWNLKTHKKWKTRFIYLQIRVKPIDAQIYLRVILDLITFSFIFDLF